MNLLRRVKLFSPNPRFWIFLLALLLPADTPRGAFHSSPPCVTTFTPLAAWGAAFFPDEELFAWKAGRELIAHADYATASCFFNFPHGGLVSIPQYWLDRGDAAWGSGNAVDAVSAWELAGIDSPEFQARLRTGYERIGQWEKADHLCKQWLPSHPTDDLAFYRCALIEVIQSPVDALPALDLISSNPYAASAASIAGVIRDALRPGDAAYLYARTGEILLTHDESWLAETSLRKSILLRPDYGEAHALLGLALENQGKDGASEYRLGVQLAPDSSTACLFFGSWLRRNRQPDLARVWLERAWRLQPGDSAVAAELAALDFNAGDIPAAESALQQAIQANPSSPGAWMALAEFYIRNEIRVEQSGLPAARQAVLLDPQNPRALELLGRAYYLLSDFTMAESLFRKAITLAPQSASLHANLGLVLQQKGDISSAISELTQAVELDPNGEIGKQAQNALDQIRASSS
jgi:Tfp pilus assembly protein PilF